MTGPTLPFVIQEHTTPQGVHWDLMLQMGNALWTWRLAVKPERIQTKPVAAERIADHPLRFLTYQGPVQNQTGSVTIADSGRFTLQTQSSEELQIILAGKILSGPFKLVRQDQSLWLFIPLSPDDHPCCFEG